MYLDDQDPLHVLYRLERKLQMDIPQLEKLAKYARGDMPPPWVPKEEVRREFHQLVQRSKVNVLGGIIDSRVERLKVKGFRLSASSSDSADQDAWQIMQANKLDRELKKGFWEALAKSRSYLSVFYPNPDLTGHDYPVIMVEDATQVYVEHLPGSHQRSAALKLWRDDRDESNVVKYANVYLPNVIYKYVHVDDGRGGSWQERDEVVNHDLGIPIIPLLNNPDLAYNGYSEIEDAIATAERINEMVFNRALAAWFAAWRQKWATGVEIPVDPETDEPIEGYAEAINRAMLGSSLVQIEDENARLGTFEATDIGQYTVAINHEIQTLGEQKRLPRHYFLNESSSVNGQSIKASEAGLVAVVRDKMEFFSEPIEEALILARRAAGEDDTPVDAEVIWADPEHRTEGELTDSVIKKFQAGLISSQTALEDLGKSPQEIYREMGRLSSDAFMRSLNEAPPPIEEADNLIDLSATEVRNDV